MASVPVWPAGRGRKSLSDQDQCLVRIGQVETSHREGYTVEMIKYDFVSIFLSKQYGNENYEFYEIQKFD